MEPWFSLCLADLVDAAMEMRKEIKQHFKSQILQYFVLDNNAW